MNYRDKYIILLLASLLITGLSDLADANPDSVIYISDSKTTLGEDIHYIRGPVTDLHAKDIPEYYHAGQFKKSNVPQPSLGLIDDVVWIAIQLQPLNEKTDQY